jgi:UDP-N-acetylglucosamine 2-epimerase (non-hydrolysing)
MTPRISLVAAARPNFMKVAPILAALAGRDCTTELVHTGQHYDHEMAGAFFEDLAMPRPDVSLGVGSGSHAEQTAGVLVAYERHLIDHRPDAVVVVGDVNATLGAALAASKLGIPVAHVEAGLRSGDWTMPEEANRVLTDRLSRWLFTPSADADANLAAEGFDPAAIHLVGNVMIDSLVTHLPAARARFDGLAGRLGLPERFAVATLHRPSNVDREPDLRNTVEACRRLALQVPVVVPLHPRTRARLVEYGIELPHGVLPTEPLGYLDFLALLDRAALVLTDSGGIQEETSVLGVPCLTFRPNTERPITITHGTNALVGTEPEAVAVAAAAALLRERRAANIQLWDGRTAGRIADVLIAALG